MARSTKPGADITQVTGEMGGEAISTIPTTVGRVTKPAPPVRRSLVKLVAGPDEVILTCVTACAIPSYGIVMSVGERRVVAQSDALYLVGTGNFVNDQPEEE